MDKPGSRHWLDRYGNGYHAWTREGERFTRPCGLVELRFDADGRYYGGRADVSSLLTLNVSTRTQQLVGGELPLPLRRHILLAFALLRLRHCLLGARAELRTLGGVEPWFIVGIPPSADAAIRAAEDSLRFVDGVTDVADFYNHALNSARLADPDEALARLLVLPPPAPSEADATSRPPTTIRFLFVMAHQIVDGLSTMRWMADFARILNLSPRQIRRDLETAITPALIRTTLPPAQEDLYAPVATTRARARWFWATTIVLRHARPPPPLAFPNPLRRVEVMPTTVVPPLSSEASRQRQTFPPRYADVLDYTDARAPPLRSRSVHFRLSPTASRRLFRLCAEAGASIGAGGFVLVGMVMMTLHEARYPSEPDAECRPFVGSFPLNPRPFLGSGGDNKKEPLDGVMLAFSKGIVLPFLPSHLDLEGRFRLLVRQAARQLAQYQKTTKPKNGGGGSGRVIPHMGGVDGPARLLASNYIDGIERLRSILPEHLRDETLPSPQGAYPAPPWSVGRATCGVSSVGRVEWPAFARRSNDDDEDEDEDDIGVAASVESLHSGVRARDYEFLIATWSDGGVVTVGLSYDADFVDEEGVSRWVGAMKTLLEEEEAVVVKPHL